MVQDASNLQDASLEHLSESLLKGVLARNGLLMSYIYGGSRGEGR
jgi:hypothetical protein